ncbi:uncharacterized protein LOC132934593 [Metopolophium dirhodum]|uniref:uncharacterized protein LOC132934593 n=1 Tax=Metopolophium dirhodum TaxID=44670 RepID=UPI00299001AE|nr:uncharacterized protein LOC132934593 [Metopolophium dirhodum]
MYLPVDKPYFYMSPSELKNIVSNIRGVKVLQVSCKVVMRNPRTAFETNASTSNLATLNQNKFVQYAHGLVNKTRGFNTVYEFATATNPMVPSACTAIDDKFMKKVISAMYGTKADDWLKPNWSVGATLPCSFMNLPMQFPSYYTMYANSAQNNGQIGWQDIQKFITKKDASAVIGSTIIDYTYKPTISYLTMPWSSVFAGRTNLKGTNVEKFRVEDTNSISLPNAFTLNKLDGSYTADVSNNYAILNDDKWRNIFSDDFNRYTEPLECGQYIKHGLRPSISAKIQPSLHIGVCPVPQLTTTNATFVPDKFTDIECMWDIETELVCEYGLPYTYTSFPTCHIELESTPMVVNNTTKESMYYEELSAFDNQFISPA